MDRRTLLTLLPAAAMAPSALAQAASLRLIVPFPVGGATDTVARIVAPFIAQQIGRNVIIDNRAGAGGSLGMAELAKAPADGWTVGLATVSTHGVNPVVFKRLPYDAERDFTPVGLLASAPGVLVVNPQVPVRTLAEFIAYARAHPGKLSYGTPGVGSAGHMAGERLKHSAGIYLVHIPYRGAAGVMADLTGGQIDVGVDQVASALPHIQAGRLRALAISWPEALTQLPGVPTFAQAGFAQNNDASWFGIVAPAGTPEPAVAWLNTAIVHSVQQPEVRAQWERLGLFPAASTPGEFAELIRSTLAQMRETARTAGISLDA